MTVNFSRLGSYRHGSYPLPMISQQSLFYQLFLSLPFFHVLQAEWRPPPSVFLFIDSVALSGR